MLRAIKKVIQLKSKDIGLCLASALMLAFSFPRANIWILAWVAFVPLFLALENKNLIQSFLLGFITGIAFWWLAIYWLVHVTFIGTFVLVLYLALYFGLFCLILRPFTRCSRLYVLILAPSVWVLLEYARSHLLTGFPWALLGHSQYLNLAAIQVSDFSGAFGVSFLVVMANAAATESVWAIRRRLWGRLVKAVILMLAFLLPALYYGHLRLAEQPQAGGKRSLRVSAVQGNIPQELKWEPRARSPIVNKYLSLSKGSLDSRPELVIWPEASFPEPVEPGARYLDRVKEFCAKNKVALLMGAVTVSAGGYYNSAMLISGSGKEEGRYNKIHLVPFGEYIPLKKIFPFLEVVVPIGDISAGKDYTIFKLAGSPGRQPLKFGVLICFEDLFPGLSRSLVGKGADFLVNITNDAWYKDTSAAEQHFQSSVFRAVENRRPVIRSANTGISGFILPSGRHVWLKSESGKELFVEGFLTQEVWKAKNGQSFYCRYGDIFVLLCLAAFIAAPCALPRRLLPGSPS